MYLPCTDLVSALARRNALREYFATSLVSGAPPLILLPLLILLSPLVWLWIDLSSRRPQPGWIIDQDALEICSVGQKVTRRLRLEPDMGLLAHHAVIEITHPARGPLLTLFTATASTDQEDKSAQEDLARLLANRLGLRLVGCRVNLF